MRLKSRLLFFIIKIKKANVITVASPIIIMFVVSTVKISFMYSLLSLIFSKRGNQPTTNEIKEKAVKTLKTPESKILLKHFLYFLTK